MDLMPDVKSVFKKKKYICNSCHSTCKLTIGEHAVNGGKCPKCGGVLVPTKLDPRVF